MKEVLLIEDDESLGFSLKKYLTDEGYGVQLVRNLAQAREAGTDFKIMILDWMLPDGQGIDFLKELRIKNTFIPVIMLTARTELVDKIVGLESGANDYLTKPFEPRELVARIRVQFRDTKKSNDFQEEKIHHNGILIDSFTREAFYQENKLELTKMEYELLKLLAGSPGRAFSREEILNKVWGFENYPSTRTVDTHVLQLRQKTDEGMIETLRGVGYRMRAIE